MSLQRFDVHKILSYPRIFTDAADRDGLSVEIRRICVDPWFQTVVHLLQLNGLDHADPVVVAQTSRGEFRDQIEDLIREAADVQDVFALLGLDRAVGLNVNADHPRLRIAPLEFGPLRHRLGGAAAVAAVTRRVDPRFAVRDVDDQIAKGLAQVEQRQGRAAIRAAAGQAGQLLGVGHHAVARVETYLKRLALKRDDLGARVAAQHSSGHQRGHVNTANLAGCALAVTSHRRMHRTRNVGEDVNLAFNIRDVADGDLHRVLKRFAHDARNLIAARVQVRREQLVREDAGLADRALVAQTVGDQLREFRLFENAVAREGVKVHTRHLPRGRASDVRPVLRAERQTGQHLERNFRNLWRLAGLEPLVLERDRGQRRDVEFAAYEVTV